MMYCLSWINAVWEQLLIGWFVTKRYAGGISLPDAILVEILSRLPAESVLECRRVCKHWNTLTSTLDFTEKHLKNATPAILIASKRLGIDEVLLVNEWGAGSRSGSAKGGATTGLLKNNMERFGPKYICPVPLRYYPSIRYYNSGLILFVPDEPLVLPYELKPFNPLGAQSHIVYNPVTREKVVLNTYGGYICACFYHPLAREYRLLWLRRLPESPSWEFKILDLGSLTEEWSWRRLANFDHLPEFHRRSAVLFNNEALHWMISEDKTSQPCCSDSIITFDINKEEFSTMPHPPGEKCTMSWRRHNYMYLFELKLDAGSGSLLCLCDCSMKHQLEVWVLEDYEKRIWVRRHRIVIEVDVHRNTYAFYDRYEIVPFSLQNGEILIHWKNIGVFAHHLKKGTMREINEVIKNGIITYVGLHSKSLVSFTNSKQRGLHFNMEPC